MLSEKEKAPSSLVFKTGVAGDALETILFHILTPHTQRHAWHTTQSQSIFAEETAESEAECITRPAATSTDVKHHGLSSRHLVF